MKRRTERCPLCIGGYYIGCNFQRKLCIRVTANSSDGFLSFFFYSPKITACRSKRFGSVFLPALRPRQNYSSPFSSELHCRNFCRNFSSGSKSYADDIFSRRCTSVRLGVDEISAKFALAGKMLTKQISLCTLRFLR